MSYEHLASADFAQGLLLLALAPRMVPRYEPFPVSSSSTAAKVRRVWTLPTGTFPAETSTTASKFRTPLTNTHADKHGGSEQAPIKHASTRSSSLETCTLVRIRSADLLDSERRTQLTRRHSSRANVVTPPRQSMPHIPRATFDAVSLPMTFDGPSLHLIERL